MAHRGRVVRALGRRAVALHNGIYRRSDGRRGGQVKGIPVLLITTTGRRTGQERTVPICFTRDDDRFVVVGTNGGADVAPAWSHNLRSRPAARVQVGADVFDVIATETTGREYDELWALFVARHPALAAYEAKTTRRIPLWQLQPVPRTETAASRAATHATP